MSIRRAIKAAQKQGLYVLAIRPDGTVVVGETPVKISDVAPPAPTSTDDADSVWDTVKS